MKQITNLHDFYKTDEWIAFRQIVISERGATCEHCKKKITKSKHIQVHHTEELTLDNVNDVLVSLNKDKVKVLCHKCHNKEHRRFGFKGHNVYIVYGSPLSGKNTLVYQLYKYGDLILDVDKIYECISGEDLYVKPDNLRFNVFRIRDYILDMIKTRYGEWQDAYIIGGYPNKLERERLAKDLNAELIYCDATKEVCHSRVLESGKDKEWNKFIDKWWEEYSP